MKTLKTLLLITGLTFFLACSSDDDSSGDTNVQRNEIKVANKNFEITGAKLFNDATFNGVTEFDFYLTGSGLSINNNKEFNGVGDFITLRLFSNTQTSLPSGDYLYNDQDSNSFILNRGTHFFNYDAALGDNQSGDLDVESGRISVSLENDTYTITFSLVDENSDAITGFYKGTISVID